jgi:Tol biopolymer transport system component
MGEVYRANDTRLQREVAVKVSAEQFGDRFKREARAVAALNHPNICTLFDVGPNYLVMELVEGPTLAGRIKEGAIPLDEALVIAKQIADALEAAHEKGITHRDLKPANIKLRPDGTVKVLDFGLAKIADPLQQSSTDPDLSPTLTLDAAATRMGAVMGTAGYMPPEQAKGKQVDKRADIWAFGVVLYEMVTGTKLFQGDDVTDILASVVKEQPDLSAAPARVRRLLGRCLEKDPRKRLRDIGDAMELVAEPLPDGRGSEGALSEGAGAEGSRQQNKAVWAMAAAAALFAGLAGYGLLRPEAAVEPTPVEFEIATPDGVSNVWFSPDGKTLVWKSSSTARLWIRAVGSVKARQIEDPNPGSVSWSPDSKYLAYISNGQVKRLDAATLVSQAVSPQPDRMGTSWTPDGYILIGSRAGPLEKVRATGGNRTPVLPLDKAAGETSQRGPIVLEDGQHVVYVSLRKGGNGTYLARLDGSGRPIKLLDRAGAVDYVAPNTLVYPSDEQGLAVEFDPDSGKVSEPIVVGELSGAVSASLSRDGSALAMLKGNPASDQVVLYDRAGKKLETLADAVPDRAAHLEMSPDGKRLLLERPTGENIDLWIVELGRNVVSRLTFHEMLDGPGVWSADGNKIYFRAERPGEGRGIYEIPSNGAGSEKLVLRTATHHMHASPDGKRLVIDQGGAVSGGLQTVDLQGGGKLETYLPTSALHPQFSPDSRMVAYNSIETGREEIYVQTYPPGKGKWQISTGGGIQPRWRGDGRELYYITRSGDVMAAAIEMRGESLEVTSTTKLFSFRLARGSGTAIAVRSDGKLFAIREGPEDVVAPITVRLGWKLPGRK